MLIKKKKYLYACDLNFFSVTKNKNFKKPNRLLKNGQKKCPFLKSQNTFANFLFSFFKRKKGT
jgi:hypothetical protein